MSKVMSSSSPHLPDDIQNGIDDDLRLLELDIVAGVLNNAVFAVRGQPRQLNLQLLPDRFCQ